jgi:hypothetical protein
MENHNEIAKKQEALKQQQERHNREAAARIADLASLCASPAFQRVMLGEKGYLTGLVEDAENVLFDDKLTPLNDLAKMAVHISRWRDAKSLHKDLSAFAETPAPTSV